MTLAFTLLFLTLHLNGMRTEILPPPRRHACAAAQAGRGMIDLGPHAVFIVWAYAGVAVAVARPHRLARHRRPPRREARLAALEAQGIRRRSRTRRLTRIALFAAAAGAARRR